MSLQYDFIKSKGAPVTVGPHTVFQRDTLDIFGGDITVRFVCSARSPIQGVQLSVKKGGAIELSDGTYTERLDIWHAPELPPVVIYKVRTIDGHLYVHNRYMVHTSGDAWLPEHWTGNAGMTLIESESNRRLYGCSDGLGEFTAEDLIFECAWTV